MPPTSAALLGLPPFSAAGEMTPQQMAAAMEQLGPAAAAAYLGRAMPGMNGANALAALQGGAAALPPGFSPQMALQMAAAAGHVDPRLLFMQQQQQNPQLQRLVEMQKAEELQRQRQQQQQPPQMNGMLNGSAAQQQQQHAAQQQSQQQRATPAKAAVPPMMNVSEPE